MFRIVSVLSFIFLSTCCFSQSIAPFDASIFKKPQAKIRDTITFEAVYKSIGKNAYDTEVKWLIRTGLLNGGDYRSAVSFIPVNSRDTFYLPYKASGAPTGKKLLQYINKQKKVIITGIAFRSLRTTRREPFFVIDKFYFE